MHPEAELLRTHVVPTILLMHKSWGSLSRVLGRDGYFILIAHTRLEATTIARMHSRPIHLLLTSPESRDFGQRLQEFRPTLHLILISERYTQSELATMLEEVRQILRKSVKDG